MCIVYKACGESNGEKYDLPFLLTEYIFIFLTVTVKIKI